MSLHKFDGLIPLQEESGSDTSPVSLSTRSQHGKQPSVSDLHLLGNSMENQVNRPAAAAGVMPRTKSPIGSSAIAGPTEEALQVLAKWIQAFNASDIEGIVSLYSPDALFIGTGSKEVGANPEYFRNYFQSLKRDMPRGAALESYSTMELSSTVVLVSGMDKVSGTKDGALFYRPGRVSFVLARREEKWQIVQFHRSAVPD